jgi:hypothetical protein
VSETPTPPADPVAAEDNYYAAIVSEYTALRRAGAGIIAAAAITSAHMTFITKANEA